MAHVPTAQDAEPRPPATKPPAPVVALKTYTALRLGVVAVIVALGFAVGRAIAQDPEHCVQRSLSAYYYTPVRPVFVGALLIIGFAMIAMWGRTFREDAALNLAGLLLTVVAFVPTLDATGCTLAAGQPQTPADKEVANSRLILANAPEVQSNTVTLLVILGVVLAGILLWGIRWYAVATAGGVRPQLTAAVRGYAVTWLLAAAATVVFLLLYRASWVEDPADPGGRVWDTHSFFNHHVHSWSANVAVALIVAAVAFAAWDKHRQPDARGRRLWMWTYGVLAAAMVVTTIVIKATAPRFAGRWYGEHETFLLESALIGLLGVFWVVQTIDRRGEGAPTY